MDTISATTAAELLGLPLRTVQFWCDHGAIRPTPETRRAGRGKTKAFPPTEIEIGRVLAEVYRTLRPQIGTLAELSDFLRGFFSAGEAQGITDWRAEYARRRRVIDAWTDDQNAAGFPNGLAGAPFTGRDDRRLWMWFDLQRAREGEGVVVLTATLGEGGVWQAALQEPRLLNDRYLVDIGAPQTGQPVGCLLVINLTELFAEVWTHPALAGAHDEAEAEAAAAGAKVRA